MPRQQTGVPITPAQIKWQQNPMFRPRSARATAPPRKYHRVLTRPIDWSTIPKTDRITRSKAWNPALKTLYLVVPDNLKGSNYWDAAQRSPKPAADNGGSEIRIKRINCRFRIPGTDIIEYYRGGQRMICPPGVEPWKR